MARTRTNEDVEDAWESDAHRPIRGGRIIGRPNAGKSTLINHLLGEERLLTQPTRPAPPRDLHRGRSRLEGGKPFRLFGTAGRRRRSRIEEKLEKLSVADSCVLFVSPKSSC